MVKLTTLWSVKFVRMRILVFFSDQIISGIFSIPQIKNPKTVIALQGYRIKICMKKLWILRNCKKLRV